MPALYLALYLQITFVVYTQNKGSGSNIGVTDVQLYLAIGIPSALFAVNLLAVLGAAFWQAKRFEDMGKRFDDMKDTINSEIGRVEGVLSAESDG